MAGPNNVSTWWSQNNPFRDSPNPNPNPNPQPQNKQDNNNPDPNLQLGPDEELVDDPQNLGTKIKRKKGSDDPMLQFESLWHPNKNEKGEIIPEDEPNLDGYLPKLDDKKFNESLSKMNFVGAPTDQQMTDIKAGGEAGMKAMMQIMNDVARRTFSVSLNATRRLSEQGFANAHSRFTGEVPNHVRDMMTTSGLSETISLADNPAFAPLVEGVKSRFLKKFPKATPAQVQNGIKQYFDMLQKEMAPKPKADNSNNSDKLRSGSQDADFMEWIEQDLKRGGSSSSPFNTNSDTDQA